jgi:putative tricarboxylic transport membrane protein
VTSNRVAAAAIIAIAAALFALTFGFEKLPEGITRGFGAEVFPRLVLGVIAALAALLAIPQDTSAALPRIPPMVWLSAAALLAFMALLPVLGMLPAMFAFLVGLGWLWGERRYWMLLFNGIVLTAAIWGVFVRGFGVQLPKALLL